MVNEACQSIDLDQSAGHSDRKLTSVVIVGALFLKMARPNQGASVEWCNVDIELDQTAERLECSPKETDEEKKGFESEVEAPLLNRLAELARTSWLANKISR